MQYQVPQFIEIEDKIFGPLTFKQFIYVAGGAGMCFLAYRFLPMPFSFLIILPVAGFSGALAFYKVNNRPFIDAVESAAKFFLNSKLYLWEKRDKPKTPEEIAELPKGAIYVPKLSESKLKELTWSLDINENVSLPESEKGEGGVGVKDEYSGQQGQFRKSQHNFLEQ